MSIAQRNAEVVWDGTLAGGTGDADHAIDERRGDLGHQIDDGVARHRTLGNGALPARNSSENSAMTASGTPSLCRRFRTWVRAVE